MGGARFDRRVHPRVGGETKKEAPGSRGDGDMAGVHPRVGGETGV